MFSGLNSLLNLKESQPIKGKFILISDDENDGSFLVNYLMSLYLKGGFKVCFIALSQSLPHYSSVAQKLGVNLSGACDSGQVKYIDGLKLISNSLCDSVKEDANVHNNPFINFSDSGFSLQPLYNQVKAFVDQSSTPCLVLIDDVSILLTLGVPLQNILDFCSYCKNLTCYNSNLIDRCFACLVHADNDVEDDESMLLWKQLSHTAHMELHVKGLSSGYCKDVHGQLVITAQDDLRLVSPKQTVTQFKIQDRVINFFAPGTSKAVL